jgi:hypothetical protein
VANPTISDSETFTLSATVTITEAPP